MLGLRSGRGPYGAPFGDDFFTYLRVEGQRSPPRGGQQP